MFLVLTIVEVEEHALNSKIQSNQKVVRKFYSYMRFKNILEKMGTALAELKNYKAESGIKYVVCIDEHDEKVVRVKEPVRERDIHDFTEQFVNFLNEAKIADKRKGSLKEIS